MTKIAIIGASIGGLVAAAELQQTGFEITIFEAGKNVAGMYGHVATPFGVQELGMHVLYLTHRHYLHLCDIFGDEALHTWAGIAVDLGANHNFGRNYFNSVYPDLRNHKEVNTIRSQIMLRSQADYHPANALEAVNARFGVFAGRNVYAPILRKLWGMEADLLTEGAIHCFFDLRRVVLWDKQEADHIKKNPWFDAVVGNPDQHLPCSTVYGGRMAARFNKKQTDFFESVKLWLEKCEMNLELGKTAYIHDSRLMIGTEPLDKSFDGCIVATPVSTIAPEILMLMDQLELSLFYFQLSKSLADSFPAYYMLLHDPEMLSSRIVNYQAYDFENHITQPTVVSVEVIHPVGCQPAIRSIAEELKKVLRDVNISESYIFPKTLKVPIPSIRNAELIDGVTAGLSDYFKQRALYFTGLRTDKGTFFSHNTIGLSHEAALDCIRKFA